MIVPAKPTPKEKHMNESIIEMPAEPSISVEQLSEIAPQEIVATSGCSSSSQGT
jgi:hypothetical protein